MTRPVLYVACDVPEGMTLADYRAAKRPAAPARRGVLGRVRRRRSQAPAPLQSSAAGALDLPIPARRAA